MVLMSWMMALISLGSLPPADAGGLLAGGAVVFSVTPSRICARRPSAAASMAASSSRNSESAASIAQCSASCRSPAAIFFPPAGSSSSAGGGGELCAVGKNLAAGPAGLSSLSSSGTDVVRNG